MHITRATMNPLISPGQVSPSSPDLRVVSVFNAAALAWGDETLLLLRVAEAPAHVAEDEVAIPIITSGADACPNITIHHFHKRTPGLDLRDPRGIIYQGEYFLTTISHLLLARSRDGLHFILDTAPALYPSESYEEYGIEDPRMTLLDGRVYITYTAVSRSGVCVALASTTDFRHYTKHGLILPPENKNVVLFPERIQGKYLMIHRPTGGGLGGLQMWLASSPDLLHWGDYRPLMAKRPAMWDSARIGAGAVPIKTPVGWLEIYHGVNAEQGYCLGAVLLDLDDPSRVLARSPLPLLSPETEYERSGFYSNVVFTCGATVTHTPAAGAVVQIYYGAVDETTCRADIPLADILDHLLTPETAPLTADLVLA
ncbi:MAG: glycoside hydrolase family 130 protein [Armatimonadota bacterium]